MKKELACGNRLYYKMPGSYLFMVILPRTMWNPTVSDHKLVAVERGKGLCQTQKTVFPLYILSQVMLNHRLPMDLEKPDVGHPLLVK